MMTDSITQMLPLLAAVPGLLAMGVAVWALTRSKRQVQQHKADHDRRLGQLEKQLKVATGGALGMGQRILVLEEKLQQLQNQNEAIGTSDGALAYAQAMKLFEQGVDANTVAASCSLSSAEVSLMAMLHNHKRNAA